MAILATLLYALLGLLLAVALIPFRARASGSVHDGLPAGTARVDWGLGLLGVGVDTGRRVTLRLLWIPVVRLRLGERRRPELEERRERRPQKEKKRGEKRRPGAFQRLRAALAERRAFPRMAWRLVRALHLRLRAEGRVGIGDPADTVTLQTLLAALEAAPGVELAIELDWMEEALELELELAARIWIAELLAVAARLLLERANRRAVRAALGWT